MRALMWRGAAATGVAAMLVLVVLVAPAQAAAATSLYVAQGGVDTGTCTSARPCATVTFALTKAAVGATIRVSGTIHDHAAISSPVKIMTWRGGPAHSPGVLDGTATPNVAVVTVTGTGVILHNLTITNGTLGILNEEGTVKLTDSTVSGNHNSGEPYAGISNYGGGTMTIIDSTIANNSSIGTYGAGIYNTGTLTVIASTIANNTGGGIYSGQGRTASLAATIVADNTRGVNCKAYDPASLDSAGYNLTSDRTGKACAFTAATDHVNRQPHLGPLTRNGGPTKTMLPAAGGPADDAIPQNTTLRGVTVCPSADQRGMPRPAKNERRCTIGAVEV